MIRTLVVAYGLALLGAAIWFVSGRSLALLGLEWPLSGASVLLLLASAVLIVFAVVWVRLVKPSAAQDLAVSKALPGSLGKTLLYVVTMLSLGAIWEVLYRGYLIWALGQFTGLWPAVIIAAVSYGLAHGIKSKKQVVTSLISALVFSGAYALSHSLWWLILVHCALPLLPFAARRREVQAV